jgi:hypothetical protein
MLAFTVSVASKVSTPEPVTVTLSKVVSVLIGIGPFTMRSAAPAKSTRGEATPTTSSPASAWMAAKSLRFRVHERTADAFGGFAAMRPSEVRGTLLTGCRVV